MERLDLIATTSAGLEACVKRELIDLGFADAKTRSPGRVGFTAGADGLAKANLWLRTADRVLLVVGSFGAADFDELFDRTRDLDWERWIPADGQFPVKGRSVKSQLSSVPACQRSVKKAIVEKLLSAHRVSALPETGPAFSVEVALRDDTATLSIDTTGPGLNKRGYRAAAGPAPLKETLAAAMVQLSFWYPDRQLVDPFCGGGTIPIEAALIGRNIAPGLNRVFTAERWPSLSADIWTAERDHARDVIKPSLPLRIIGTDIDEKAISLSRHHADLAGVADDIHFQQHPFQTLTSSHEYGCVICNPPYGHRFDEGDVKSIYEAMPAVFRTLKTWSFYVITSLDLEKILGQSADRRRKLYNGRLECTYYQYHGPRPPKAHAPRPTEEEIAPAAAFGGLEDTAATDQAEMFANRLRKNARHLRRWPGRGVTCYRVYDRDIPEIPLAVDIYEGRLHIAEYERPNELSLAQHADWLDLLVKTAGETLDVPADAVFFKRRQRQRGTDQYTKVDRSGSTITVQEGDLAFEVNLSDYLDTGLFLDHRITRDMVRADSGGRRMLNLFSYTGSFSVYAANGQAASTTSVDLSKTYLDWAGRNFKANGLELGTQHRLIRSDAMEFLRNHHFGPSYDLAVIDPPTFSNSKRTEGVFDVQRDYIDLLKATAALMSPGGVIYFSTNLRSFKFDPTALPGLEAEDITTKTIPQDFRNKRIHSCWRLIVPY
jgi:23S rRNA (guanine2445-N2)-methyltransferase / 23S rRNA (guanine2069-N7)-methyltransferase